MALNLDQKKAIISELEEVAKKAVSAIAADYRGLTVAKMTELRAKARVNDVYLKIARNTLIKRALTDTPYKCMEESLTGSIALFFSLESPGAAARIIKDFMEDNGDILIRALVVDGQLIPVENLDSIAKLPTYDEAIALLMSVMKAPVTKFVRTLVEPHSKMVRTFAAIRDRKN